MEREQDAIEHARHLEHRLHVLSEALRAFAEATTDYDRLLDVVARRLSDSVGDGCVVRLLSPDGWLKVVAMHLPIEKSVSDAEEVARIRASGAEPRNVSEHPAMRRVLETGEALLVPRIDLDQLRVEVGAEMARNFEAVGVHSMLWVALRARGQPVGTLALYRFVPGSAPLDDRDLDLAQTLADHAALAIDNARLARTEREAAERRRQEDHARFRQLVESLADPVFVHREGTIVYVNPAFLAWWGGGGAESFVGRSAYDAFVHPDERARVVTRVRSVAEGNAAPFFETRWLRRDGSVRTVQTTGVALDFDGAPAHVVAARDVTDLREAQRRLALSDRMASVGTLAAGIAHEINNPLSYVTANLEMITHALSGGQSPPGRTVDQLAADARQGAERVRKIVRGLHAFSRGGDEEKRVRLDVRQVIEIAIDLTHNEVRHRARLVRDYGDAPPVEADEGRLGQVFINLLVNAAQAIPEGRADDNEIRVVTSTDVRGRAVVEVHDTGRGIPSGAIDHVFDPFFTTKPVGEGTGLGLSICHGIVTALGGEIDVRSEEGKGTVMRVALPPAQAGVPSRRSRPPSLRPPPSARGARGHVLVVDDDPLVGAALRRMLEGHHDVTVATDGQQALDLLLEGRWFDVILCDLMMPQVSGMEVYARLSCALPEIVDRIVFITGGAFTAAARAFLDSVPNDCVEKPLERRALLALVAGFVHPDAPA